MVNNQVQFPPSSRRVARTNSNNLPYFVSASLSLFDLGTFLFRQPDAADAAGRRLYGKALCGLTGQPSRLKSTARKLAERVAHTPHHPA